MRVSISKSKNSKSYYIKKDIVVEGKRTSIIVEKLGNENDIKAKIGDLDPLTWAKERAKALTKKEKAGIENTVNIEFHPNLSIEKGKQRLYNGGYIFFKKIYNDLKISDMCFQISQHYKFEYDLDSILSKSVFTRLMAPTSTLSVFDFSETYFEKPNFSLQEFYRGLEIIKSCSEFIQNELYENIKKDIGYKTDYIYYDRTNIFFEFENYNSNNKILNYNQEKGIIRLGLLTDSKGMPLAFNIIKDLTDKIKNFNSIEKQILDDFKDSKIIIISDANLKDSSKDLFPNNSNKYYIDNQSIKMLDKDLKEWSIKSTSWNIIGSDEIYDINQIEEANFCDNIFYKEKIVNENGINKRLIILYSVKEKNKLKSMRTARINKTMKVLENHTINNNEHEEGDGFYAISTDSDLSIEKLSIITTNRWKMEECMRMIKLEFTTKSVYLNNNDKIEAHLINCYIALTIYRYLDKKLDYKYTYKEIMNGMTDMNFCKIDNLGFIPLYKRSEFTDDLNKIFGFQTDKEIISIKKASKIYHSINDKAYKNIQDD